MKFGLMAVFALCCPIICGEANASSVDTAVIVRPATENLANMFDLNAPVVFDIMEAGKVNYTVSNQHGRVMASGSAEKQIKLPGLPRGYYRIFLSAASKTFVGFRDFSVIADPSGKTDFEMPYSMVVSPRGAMPYFKGSSQELFAFFASLCKKSGLKTVRSLFRWRVIDPVPDGQFDFGIYDPEFNAYAENGIKASWVWDQPPRWATRNKENFPRDLKVVYDAAKATAARYRGKAAAWEFWNEQDVSYYFNGEPWEFASMAKAAYLGFKAGDPETPVSAGSLCIWPINDMLNELLGNDLGAYADFINWHFYGAFKLYEPLIAKIRSILTRHGIGDMPIWITENGTGAEGNAILPNRLNGKVKSLTPEQEMVWSEMVPKGQIIFQSLGVSRTFTFIMRNHHENNGLKEWGMLRNDFTAKPALPAFITMVYELAGLEYEGTLYISPDIQAYLYRDANGRQTLAVWANSALDTSPKYPLPKNLLADNITRQVTLRCYVKDAKAVDHFGSPVLLKNGAGTLEFTASRYITYIHNLSGLRPTIKAPRVAVSPKPDAAIDKSVVLSAYLNKKGDRLVLEAWNFDSKEKRGKLVSSPRIPGLPEQTVIPAMGKISVQVSLPETLKQKYLCFSGEFNGKKISRIAIGAGKLGKLGKLEGVPVPKFMEMKYWTPRGSAPVKFSFDKQEQALRFDMDPAQGGWVYPEFDLDKAGISLKGYMGISYEIRMMQLPAFVSNPTLCWFVFRDGIRPVRCNQTPSVGEWRRNTIMFPTDKPASIRAVQIGLNPKVENITFFIRNVTLIPADVAK